MYSIAEGRTRIYDEAVNVFKREIVQGDTYLKVIAGTTGYKKGTSRAGGGRTYINIDCFDGDFHFNPITDENGGVVGIEIVGCGCESLDVIMKALTFVHKVLDDQRRGVED